MFHLGDAGDATLVTQIFLLITVVVGHLVTLYQQWRERKWQVEAKEAAAKERAAMQTELGSKIDQNTEITKQAMQDVSEQNKKLVELAQERNAKYDGLLRATLGKAVKDDAREEDISGE